MVTQPQIQDGPRWTTMTVINAVPATSRDGREQWELTVRWEWTPTANRYGQRIWVFKEETPADVTRLGAFTVQVERGRLVAKSEASGGGFHEGSRDWQWHWKILAWDGAGVSAPAPAPYFSTTPIGQDTPQPPQAEVQAPVIQRAPAGSIDETQMMIMRQSTLNYATILMAPVVQDYNSEDLIRVTTQMASKLLEYVITGEVPRVESPDAEVEF